MAQTTISDFVIWAKHIHGDPAAAARIREMKAGEVVNLRVDGVAGAWRKMDDGRDGRPTPGIRPIGRTAEFWRELYKKRRGEVVGLEVADAAQPDLPPLPIYPAGTPAERQAALEVLKAIAAHGWRSEGPYGPRDEAYDR